MRDSVRATLLASLRKEQPECCVCFDELHERNATLLSCNVVSDSGPFHATCESWVLGTGGGGVWGGGSKQPYLLGLRQW